MYVIQKCDLLVGHATLPMRLIDDAADQLALMLDRRPDCEPDLAADAGALGALLAAGWDWHDRRARIRPELGEHRLAENQPHRILEYA